MDDKTIKEISDVITAEVMKQVQANLSAMKPHIIEEIKNSVLSEINNPTSRGSDTPSKDEEKYEERFSSRLTQRWGTPDLDYDAKNKILLSCKEVNNLNPNAVDNSSILSVGYMDDIINGDDFLIKDGWIYYITTKIHKHGKGLLFRVRLNGTGNIKISKEVVLTYDKIRIWGKHYKYAEFYIEDTTLHYTNDAGLPRTLDIRRIL